LVLHGFAPSDRYRIGEAVDLELTRLFAEQGVPLSLAQNIESAQMNAGAFKVASDSKAETIGVQIAQAV
jgi:hypothetical protein